MITRTSAKNQSFICISGGQIGNSVNNKIVRFERVFDPYCGVTRGNRLPAGYFPALAATRAALR
jgi:hypothetical protein